MKKLLAILVLSLYFITPSQADNIRDFQIENISVGDELKNHISNNILKNGRKYTYKSPEYVSYEFRKLDLKPGFLNFYDNIILTINNSNIIEGVGGMIFYPDDIKGCRKEQSKVKSEVQKLFPKNRFISAKSKHGLDKTGRSLVYHEKMETNDQHVIIIQCFDWNNKALGYTDNLRVTIRTDDVAYFYAVKAY